MPVTINGSPTHVLIVHAVVVLLPVAVLASLVLVVVPATRRAFALLTLLVAFVACVAIPLAFASGSELEARLPPSPLISRHVHLAHELLPLAAVFGVVLAVFVVVDMVRRSRTGRLNDLERRLGPFRDGRTSTVVTGRLSGAHRVSAGLLVVLAVLTGVQVYRVGDAGAKAAWAGRLSHTTSAIGTPSPQALGPVDLRVATTDDTASRNRSPAVRNPLTRIGPEPLAAKVPEITVMFWVIKLLTTFMGEATSDYLGDVNILLGGVVEIGLLVLAVWIQFRCRRYVAAAYWFLAMAIAIIGTGASDTLHVAVGIPYIGTTILWAVVLTAVFWRWHRSEGTLSIHSITTTRRETFYWGTVFATFALGTALGDLTATSFGLGYLPSGLMFGGIILIPALAWWKLRLNAIVAFWFAYVVTRPLGASFADYVSKPHAITGVDFGDGPTAGVAAIAIVILVACISVARNDIQTPAGADAASAGAQESDVGQPASPPPPRR